MSSVTRTTMSDASVSYELHVVFPEPRRIRIESFLDAHCTILR
ncbi:hypothetical protein LINPERHAP1_LOCUS8417 [Linum perenne]